MDTTKVKGMRDIDLAWAAGFFDGEGYICIQTRGSKKYKGQYLRIGINHVDIRPLQRMQYLFGGSIRTDSKIVGNRKRRSTWGLSTSKAAEFLKVIRPYLINKDIVADIALDFQKTIGNHGQPVSSETQLLRQTYATRLKLVNSES